MGREILKDFDEKDAPDPKNAKNSLANLLRPQKFLDFFGQNHLTSENSPFFCALKNKNLTHSFFYGPPGTGKTTLARLVARDLRREIFEFSGVDFRLEQIRNALKFSQNPVIFIDEIHALSKNQQEFLLPIMENNTALILGASTENPFHRLTQAVRSRSMLFRLEPLDTPALKKILQKALQILKISLDPDAETYLLSTSAGDARGMLNLLEFCAQKNTISLQDLRAVRPFALSGQGNRDDTHYRLISALIKSMRGSDENASIFYLAELLNAGEDAEFIARRLVIFASEDIGNANPNALNLAVSTLLAAQNIGMPEARICLSQCVIFLASCPKSNTAYVAINAAMAQKERAQIPENLIPGSKNYLYPHDFGGYVAQKYTVDPKNFVKKTTIGFEATLNSWLQKIRGF